MLPFPFRSMSEGVPGGPFVFLTLLLTLPRPSDAYYYSGSSCTTACSPSSPSTTYSTCLNYCYGCLNYWYSCYSYFQPYFNGTTFYDSDCKCYWPWWSWTLLAIGIALLLGAFVYSILACRRRRKMLKEQQAQYEAQMAQGGYPVPPPPGTDGAYPPSYPPYPGGPPAGYPQGAPPMYGATTTGYPVEPPPNRA